MPRLEYVLARLPDLHQAHLADRQLMLCSSALLCLSLFSVRLRNLETGEWLALLDYTREGVFGKLESEELHFVDESTVLLDINEARECRYLVESCRDVELSPLKELWLIVHAAPLFFREAIVDVLISLVLDPEIDPRIDLIDYPS